MTTTDIALKVIAALNRAGVPHMLVGSFSSNAYGIARSTKDVDFVVQLDAQFSGRLADLLGPEFEPEQQMSFETNTGTQRQEFHVKGTEFKVELFRLSSDEFDQQRFTRRQSLDLCGHRVFMPTPEDVIVMKLRWARKKDQQDVFDVMAVQRGRLDWAYIENWCRRHGTFELMDQIRRAVPEI
jgi:predicted nucleotidyltransferase